MPSRKSPKPAADDLLALRGKLPSHWWAEVRRVRALVDHDAETASLAATHFVYAAQAMAEAGLEGEHVRALYAASERLTRMASA